MVNDWVINPVAGGDWSMNFAQVVPVGAFSNVNFQAILRGTIRVPGSLCRRTCAPCRERLKSALMASASLQQTCLMENRLR